MAVQRPTVPTIFSEVQMYDIQKTLAFFRENMPCFVDTKVSTSSKWSQEFKVTAMVKNNAENGKCGLCIRLLDSSMMNAAVATGLT